MASLSSLSPREELLQIQKKIFARNDEIIRSQAMVQEPGFEQYERRYRRHVRQFQRVADFEELIEEILQRDLIYIGDYHTNPQSQRTLLRIMKQMVASNDRFALGLEIVERRHQKHLDDYLHGRIAEETFLERIKFRKYWYFDLWENFKPILDFAKFHQIPVYGIEYSLRGHATLDRRDQKNAQIIVSLMENNPGQRLVVFIGDLHITPSHLPRRVEEVLQERGRSKKDLIVYQNSESIYWALAEREIEHKTDIVQISPREFCIINTPPIVWQQTFINWLEHEEGEIDYVDAKHSFLEILREIADFLGLKVHLYAQEVEVYTCGDLSFLRTLSERDGFSKEDLRMIKEQVLASESYCIPRKNYVYLGNLSINHAAEEASHYLKYLSAGEETERDPIDAFYANIIHEAVGFFGSKIINHKRKCFHEKEYEGLIQFLTSQRIPRDRRLELETSILILRHRDLDRNGLPIRSRQFFRSRYDLFFGVTHGLGYMLGDKLYYALIEGKISKQEIRDLFRNGMRKEGEPFETYRQLLKKVRGVKIPRRV